MARKTFTQKAMAESTTTAPCQETGQYSQPRRLNQYCFVAILCATK